MIKERIIHYRIPNSYEGHKISEFLRNQRISTKSIIRLKSDVENVLLNDEPGFINRILKKDDRLTLCVKELESSKKIPPVDLPLSIIYEDEDILIVNKPANMPIHPSMNNYENTLGNAVAYYYMKKGEPFLYRCINRLDRDTTGLTILAKHYLSCGILYDEMESREIKRTYYAIVENRTVFDAPYAHRLLQTGTIDLPLGRRPDSAIERMVDIKNGDKAITHYRVLATNDGLSLLELQLDTGRTHQIRVHMQAIGHPLIGDFLYNPKDTHMKRQALHAGKLSFRHPITKEILSFTAPVPQDMQVFFPDRTLS